MIFIQLSLHGALGQKFQESNSTSLLTPGVGAFVLDEVDAMASGSCMGVSCCDDDGVGVDDIGVGVGSPVHLAFFVVAAMTDASFSSESLDTNATA